MVPSTDDSVDPHESEAVGEEVGRGIDLHLSGRAADQQLVHVIRLTRGWCWATADFRRSYLHSIDVQITIATPQITDRTHRIKWNF
jgi:hypothetical protein